MTEHDRMIEEAMRTPRQTAQIAWLNHQRAEHPADGLTPARLARLLREAEEGDVRSQAELFADILERDAHIAAEMGKRVRAVTRLNWSLVPPDNASEKEKQGAQSLEQQLRQVEELRQLMRDLLDAIGHGYACVEIEWDASRQWPRRFHHREQRLFRVYREHMVESIRLHDVSPHGQPLRPYGWLVHIVRARSGSLTRAPLFRTIAWLFLLKSFALGDWAEFLEVYGYPIKLGKYGPQASKEDRDTLMRAVVDIGRRAGGIIPETMRIDLLNAVDGDADAFQRLVTYADTSVSKLILGGTLTSQADGKSSTNALGNVHDDVRIEVRDDDADDLAATLTRDLVLPLGLLHGWITDPQRAPRWQFDTSQAEDLKLYAESLPALVGLGMQVDGLALQERLRLPLAAKPEDALRIAPAAQEGVLPPGGAPIVAASAQNAPSKIARALSGDAHASPTDAVDAISEDLAKEAEAPLGDWVRDLRELAERADSLEQLRDMVLTSYASLPTERLATVMEAAFALAALRAVEHVRDES